MGKRLQLQALGSILSPFNPGNYNPMNFLLRLIIASLFPKPKLQRRQILDCILFLVVCYLIVLYKVLKTEGYF